MSLPEDSLIVISLIKKDPLNTSKEAINVSVDPTNKIINSPASNVDDTNASCIFKIEKKARIVRVNGRRVRKLKRKMSTKPRKQYIRTKITKSKPRSSGYNRWGQEKDVQMFQTLKQICSNQNVNIEDFWNDDLELTENHQNILLSLKYRLHWRRRTSAMLKRIQMLAKNQSLSVRERMALRKFVIKARKNKAELVVEDIAYMFPGKSTATLESDLNNYKNNNGICW